MKPLVGLLVLAATSAVPAGRSADPPRPAPPARVDYNRDVRPILAENCFKCHGRDEKARKAGLRLDTREGLLGETSTGRAVVPKDPAKSDLIARISASDPTEVM